MPRACLRELSRHAREMRTRLGSLWANLPHLIGARRPKGTTTTAAAGMHAVGTVGLGLYPRRSASASLFAVRRARDDGPLSPEREGGECRAECERYSLVEFAVAVLRAAGLAVHVFVFTAAAPCCAAVPCAEPAWKSDGSGVDSGGGDSVARLSGVKTTVEDQTGVEPRRRQQRGTDGSGGDSAVGSTGDPPSWDRTCER